MKMDQQRHRLVELIVSGTISLESMVSGQLQRKKMKFGSPGETLLITTLRFLTLLLSPG